MGLWLLEREAEDVMMHIQLHGFELIMSGINNRPYAR